MKKNLTKSVLDDLPPSVVLYVKRMESFRTLFPWLTRYLMQEAEDFRGFSIFVSDRGGYAASLRTWRSDNQPVVLYTSASSPMEALFNMEEAIVSGRFYPDKRAPEYDPKLEAKK